MIFQYTNTSRAIRSLFLPALAIATAMLPASATAGDPPRPCLAPELLDNNDMLDNPVSFTIEGNFVYIIDEYGDQLTVLYRALPGFPILSTTEFILPDAQSITIHGDYAYIISYDTLHVYNIEEPLDPWFIREYPLETYEENPVYIHGDYMYINEFVFNISRPAAPVVDAELIESDMHGIIHIDDTNNIAYSTELAILDITDPLNPTVISESITGADTTEYNPPFFYSSHNNEISIHELTSPTSIEPRLNYGVDHTDYAFKGSIGFFVDGDTTQIIDLSNPSDPLVLENFDSLKEIDPYSHIQLIDNTFYMMDDDRNFSSFDIPTNPIATYDTPGEANEIEIVYLETDFGPEKLALIADGLAGMHIFDIDDPNNPQILSTFQTNNEAIALDVSGSIAYIASHQAGLDIVDFSDPYNPVLLANFDTGRTTRDVEIRGSLAYAVDRIDGLNIIDISEPTNPTLVSITNTDGWAEDITLHENLAIVPHAQFDLQIFDISDPSNPQVISTITPLDQSIGIDTALVRNDLLYTCENSGGIRIWDFTNPAAPSELTTINTNTGTQPGFAHELAFHNSIMILANGSAGLSIYNNADPLNPDFMFEYDANLFSGTSSFRRIAIDDATLFTTVSFGGFRIFNIFDCTSPCPVDFDNDSELGFFDISYFLSAHMKENPAGDFNNDGRFNFYDISEFLTQFAQGCP